MQDGRAGAGGAAHRSEAGQEERESVERRLDVFVVVGGEKLRGPKANRGGGVGGLVEALVLLRRPHTNHN